MRALSGAAQTVAGVSTSPGPVAWSRVDAMGRRVSLRPARPHERSQLPDTGEAADTAATWWVGPPGDGRDGHRNVSLGEAMQWLDADGRAEAFTEHAAACAGLERHLAACRDAHTEPACPGCLLEPDRHAEELAHLAGRTARELVRATMMYRVRVAVAGV